MLDQVLFVAFPYAAILTAIIVGLYRYFFDRYSYSSFSSQFLENRALFWGSAGWHYAIIIILTAHVLAAVFPRAWAELLSVPIRLYILEITGLALAFLALTGLIILLIRRLLSIKMIITTTFMDWILLIALLFQVFAGLHISLAYRWGGLWYLNTAVPWLWSLFSFKPDIQHVVTLPWLVKFHFLNAFFVIALFPFTRLVHVFTVPIPYLWRPYQLVIWNRKGGGEFGRTS